MKIYFVGVHNKAGLMPLDPISKSGKIISVIIRELGGVECVRTNLYDMDEMPRDEDADSLDWHMRYNTNLSDVFVLLGAIVHEKFVNVYFNKIVKLPHPASTFYSGKKNDEYVSIAIEKINQILNQTT